MNLRSLVNLVLTIALILSGVLFLVLRLAPPHLLLRTSTPQSAAPFSAQAEDTPPEGETGSKQPVPFREMVSMFFKPVVVREEVPEEAPPPEETPPPIVYDTTRLSFLGFLTSGDAPAYLIKDNLFGDVFSIGLGEEVFGFTLVELDSAAGVLFFTAEDAHFRVLIR